MSFILDALKKSESERLRKSTPGVADIPAARPAPRTPRWLWIVAALLVVNLGVLAAVLLRPQAEAGNASVTRALQVPDTGPPAPAFSDVVAAAKERHRAAATAEPATVSPPERRTTDDTAGRSPAAVPDAGTAREPAAARETAPVDIGTLPTFIELEARGELGLPPLHLDLHVYAERPADRFVVVNMHRYREGEALAEGPTVRHILPHGVVLEQQGTAFFLPR